MQSSAAQDRSGHHGEQRVEISRSSHAWHPSLRNNYTRMSVAVIIVYPHIHTPEGRRDRTIYDGPRECRLRSGAWKPTRRFYFWNEENLGGIKCIGTMWYTIHPYRYNINDKFFENRSNFRLRERNTHNIMCVPRTGRGLTSTKARPREALRK